RVVTRAPGISVTYSRRWGRRFRLPHNLCRILTWRCYRAGARTSVRYFSRIAPAETARSTRKSLLAPVNSNIFRVGRSPEEYLLSVVEEVAAPTKQPADRIGTSAREEAVRRMLEFGEKYHLSLGEPLPADSCMKGTLLMAAFILDANFRCLAVRFRRD